MLCEIHQSLLQLQDLNRLHPSDMSDSRNSQNSDETRIAGEIDHLSGTGMAETRVAADRDPPATPTSGSSNCDPSATRIASGDLLRERGAEATANPIERWKVGDRINEDYEVREIHRGGMGVVYGTFHHPSGTLRALKTLQDRFASIPRLRKAFEAEAAIWLRLEKHPFIAQALGIEMVDDLPYVVTEFIPAREGRGADLRSWIGDPTVGLPSALEFAIQIAQGMQHAVSIVSGLVHRDLKPANILVNDRFQAMVTDFGLAASAGLEGGTPAYMAPEQWRNEALDSRTDIYAFGCILYELLTRHRVFAAITEGQWKAAHAESQPYPPRGHVPDLPAELEAFVLACLQKNRDLRPPSWDQVVGFLALQFHRITGQPVIADFSNYRPTAEDVVRAGFDFTVLGEQGEEALKLFDRALAAGTLSLGGYAASVFCCASGLESGHEEAALRVWNKLIVHAMNPAFPNSALFYLSRALFHRLRLLLQMGRSEEALRCQVEYQQVVECVSSRNGDNGEDVRVFRAKVEVDTIELLSSLLGPEKVIVACEANIARFGNDTHPEVHFSVCTAIGAKGKALRKAKRSEEFESFSKEVLARFPDDQGVKEAVDNARNSFVGIAANLPGRPTFDLHLKAKEPVALNFKLPLADPSKAHQGSANEARNPLFPNHGAFDFNFSLPAEPRSVASPEAPRMGRTEGPGWGASAAPFERKPPRRWPILLAIGVVAVLIGLCLFGLPVP